MGLVSVPQISDGTTADASDVNNQTNAIAAEFNGNIDNANIKALAAIDSSKITFTTSGLAVQSKTTVPTAVATGTTLIPLDDTIPQITEGTEFMTLAITPKSATNILVIQVQALCSFSAAAGTLVTALFQDATANALAATAQATTGSNFSYTLSLTYSMVAGTTSSTTFRARIGNSAAGTVTFNGASATRLFGAITKSSIVITEYIA